jgi:4-hydroxy-3-methylbut-2-enyl diphosphate reductase
MTVSIQKARELGFCFGVRRAIELIETANTEHGDISTLGPIVHNETVVSRLENLGVRAVNDLSELQGETIAIASHGASPALLEEIRHKGLNVIDTTCPIVSSAQRAAKSLAEEGFGVIIFGESSHPEVKGLMSWAGEGAVATLGGEELSTIELPRRLGILSQTTQSITQYNEFIHSGLTAAFPYVHEVRIINTLCTETQKRQQAAVELANISDLMVVIGGRNSANTKRLADVCSPIVETYLIETACELQDDWFLGKEHVGITAGASTPDEAIEAVIAQVEAFAGNQCI